MARYSQGYMGPFQGKLGPAVGSSWKDVAVIRSKPGRRKSPPTAKQLEQQAKFATAIEFLEPMVELVKISFIGTKSTSSYNEATKNLLEIAITGAYPDYSVTHSKVLISKGKLPGADNPVATASAGAVTFTWTSNAGTGKAKADDQAILVAYCEELKQCVYTLIGARRDAGTATLAVPEFSGKVAHTWLSFISPNGKIAAISRYTGQIAIA